MCSGRVVGRVPRVKEEESDCLSAHCPSGDGDSSEESDESMVICDNNQNDDYEVDGDD